MLVGCKKEDIVITVEDVHTNTVLMNDDGTVQAATVEEFNKDYYNLTELNTFITEQINSYNNANGEDSIAINTLEIKEGNAILILDYATIQHYAAFNEVEAYYSTIANVKNGDITLPDVFISASDGSYSSKELALKNDNYQILVINENTDVIVDGAIKFYSNAVLVNKSKLQTASEGQAYVIFKP
jgi:hypothetical protein